MALNRGLPRQHSIKKRIGPANQILGRQFIGCRPFVAAFNMHGHFARIFMKTRVFVHDTFVFRRPGNRRFMR